MVESWPRHCLPTYAPLRISSRTPSCLGSPSARLNFSIRSENLSGLQNTLRFGIMMSPKNAGEIMRVERYTLVPSRVIAPILRSAGLFVMSAAQNGKRL